MNVFTKKALGCLFAALVFGCSSSAPEDAPTAPEHQPANAESVRVLQETIAPLGLEAIGEAAAQDPAKVELGRMLFFDPILSGSRDISCATCHQMSQATADEFALSSGPFFRFDEESSRAAGPQHRLTIRTSPPLFHRGHREFTAMFWDSRLEKLADGRIVIHERSYPKLPGHYYRIMPEELDSLLAAQATLPVHSRDEMRGVAGTTDIHGEFNEVAPVAGHHLEGTWRRLMSRLLANDEYRQLFAAAYPDHDLDRLQFAHAANAIAAFQIEHFSPHNSRTALHGSF